MRKIKNRFERWERTRAKGKWSFVLIYGVIYWGLGTALAFSVIFPLVVPNVSFMSVLPWSIIMFPLGGAVWAVIMWALSERTYQKYKASEKDAPAGG